MENILITGGAGFIGCALSGLLAGKGHRIIAFDNLHPQIHSERARPEALHPEVELVVGDVSDALAWDGLLGEFKPTIVYHLAAETGTGQSLLEATRHGNVNVVGTTQMTDAFSRHKISPRRMILTSSRAVYGEGAWCAADGSVFYPGIRTHEMLAERRWQPRAPDGGPSSPLAHRAEVVFPRPTSIYGATKLAQEHVLDAWCSAMNVELRILRLQNVYGAGQSPINPYTGIITLFHRLARSGKSIPVYEDGEIVRDFIYIDDVGSALLEASESKSYSGPVDVGTGRRVSILQAARTIAALHGAPDPHITGQFRDGDVRSAVADVAELAKFVDVDTLIPFERGAELVGRWLIEKGYA